MTVGILLSLIPLFAWGISDFSASKLSRMHPAAITLVFSAISLAHVAVLVLIFGLPDISIKILLPHFAASLILSIAFMFFVRAYSTGAVGVVTPIGNSYAVLTALISAVFLGVVIAPVGWAAILVVITGIVLLTYKNDGKRSHKDFKDSILFSLLAMVFFGTGFIFFDVASTQSWHHNFVLFQVVHVLVSAALYMLIVRKRRLENIKQVFSSRWAYIGFSVGALGTVGIFAAIDVIGSATIPAVVSAASPLVTSYLAFFFDKERLSAMQRAGAVVVVAGIMLLSL